MQLYTKYANMFTIQNLIEFLQGIYAILFWHLENYKIYIY